MDSKGQRIAAALVGACGTTDGMAVWREHFADHQMHYADFLRLENALASSPRDIVDSLLETQGQSLESRFNAAQPDYVSAEEFRTAWLAAIAEPAVEVQDEIVEATETEDVPD